ncbi:MAG: hypothetical protein ACOY3Y_04245 [Acidobacteriota bacterium]
MTRRTLIAIRVAWVAVTALLMATWNGDAWVLLLVLPALGPILREAAPAADFDERQRLVDYRASHWALAVLYLVLFLLFARAWLQLRKEPPIELWLVLLAPLVVRTVLAVVQGFGGRNLAVILGFVCGAAWLAFSTASHGISPETAIGLGIIAFTALGIRWPRLGGTLLAVAAVGCAALLIPVGVRNTGGDWVFVAVMALALPFPLLLAGVGMIASAVRASRPASDEFGDLRRTS